MRTSGLCLLAIALCFVAPASSQQPIPLGSEFQVNTTTTNGQMQPDVSMAADGSFVVVWSHGTDDYGPGAAARDIRAQRFDPSGAVTGVEFEVVEFTAQDQFEPTVSVAELGRFVVGWIEGTSSGYRTEVRQFDANGTPSSGDFKINTTGNSDFHQSPDVAILSDGDSVMAWNYQFAAEVKGRLIDPAGNPFPPLTEIAVNSTPSQDIQGSSLAGSQGVSRFVVAWGSTEGTAERIRGRLFDADGDAIGTDFQVNTNTTVDQKDPAVAVDAAGNFVVVWTDGANAGGGQDGSGEGIRAQRFDSSGSFRGAEFQVNSYTTGNQSSPQVGMSAAGDFVVAWVSDGSAGSDTDGKSVQARHFSPNGIALGPDFQVNSYTVGGISSPAVGQGLAGDFVIAWDDNVFPQAEQDGDSSGIFAQRYRSGLTPIFADGFESGDLSLWTSAAP